MHEAKLFTDNSKEDHRWP